MRSLTRNICKPIIKTLKKKKNCNTLDQLLIIKLPCKMWLLHLHRVSKIYELICNFISEGLVDRSDCRLLASIHKWIYTHQQTGLICLFSSFHSSVGQQGPMQIQSRRPWPAKKYNRHFCLISTSYIQKKQSIDQS